MHAKRETEALVPARQYRPEIDGLRAIAVLSVVLFHAELTVFSGGFVGVDVFFVISGYLISRNILEDIEAKRFTLRSFYVSRFKRLLPAFLFAILLTFILGALILSPSHFLELGKTTVNATLSLSNIHFWQDADYFAIDSQYVPLLHTWSLSVEEQFYAIWPLFLLACLTYASRRVLLWLLFAIGAASLAAAVWVFDVDRTAGFYLMPFRMFEFCIGALCLWFERRKTQSVAVAESSVLLGYFAIAISVFTFDQSTPFPSYYALLPCIGTALIIVYGGARFSGAPLRTSLAVGIGLISYSLYLFHWPFLVYAKYIKFGPLTPAETSAAIALAVGVSIFSFYVVERPFRRLSLFGSAIRPTSFIIGTLSVALFAVTLGGHVWGGKGWKFRVDRPARVLLWHASFDVSSPCRAPSEALKPIGVQCLIGAPTQDNKPDVFLLGDSHVEHWIPGLDAYFAQKNLSAAWAGKSAALPFVIGRSMRTWGPGDYSYDKVFEYIRQSKPKLVVLGSRWGAYAHASRPDGAAIWYELDEPGNATPEASQKAMARAASETFKFLERIGTKVVFLGQVPLAGYDVIACLTRPKLLPFAKGDRTCNGFSADWVNSRDRLAKNLFTPLTEAHDNVTYVDIANVLCDESVCHKTRDGTVLYRDDDHLSFKGSILLTQQNLAETIDNLLE